MLLKRIISKEANYFIFPDVSKYKDMNSFSEVLILK